MAKMAKAKKNADSRILEKPGALRGATALRLLALTLIGALNLAVLIGVYSINERGGSLSSVALELFIRYSTSQLPFFEAALWLGMYLINVSGLLLAAHMARLSREGGDGGRRVGLLPWLLAALPMLVPALLRAMVYQLMNSNLSIVTDITNAVTSVSTLLALVGVLLVAVLYELFVAELSVEMIVFRMEARRKLRREFSRIVLSSLRNVFAPLRLFFSFVPWFLALLAITGLTVYVALAYFTGLSYGMGQFLGYAAFALAWLWGLGYGPVFWTRYALAGVFLRRSLLREKGILNFSGQ